MKFHVQAADVLKLFSIDFFISFLNDFIGNAVLCVACVLFVSYLREAPPKFEGKRIGIAGIVLAVGAFLIRLNQRFAQLLVSELPAGEDAFADFIRDMDFGKLSVGDQICIRVELLNATVGAASICMGAFILMRIAKAKHIMPMVGVQVLGFLMQLLFETPYKTIIEKIVNSIDPEAYIKLSESGKFLHGYNGFAYGCFMIIMIIAYIFITRHTYENFWTKKVNVGKHILSLIGLVIAYTAFIVVGDIIIGKFDFASSIVDEAANERIIFELLINIFLIAVLLFVPIRTYKITKGELQSDYYEVKRKEKVELYTYTQSQNKAIRKYIHDLSKHFRALNAMAEKIGADEIVQYISELDKSLLAAKSEFSTGNAFLDELLLSELKTAQNNNTSINFVGVFPDEGIKRHDITTIFMNLIDNAIEACRSVSEKREILIESKIIEDRVFVTFSNPFEHKLKKSHGKFETTAKDNQKFHGYGMSSVMSVVKKEEYDGTFLTEQKDNTFIVSVDMKFAR